MDAGGEENEEESQSEDEGTAPTIRDWTSYGILRNSRMAAPLDDDAV